MSTLLGTAVPPGLAAFVATHLGPGCTTRPAPGVHGQVQTWQIKRDGRTWYARWGRPRRKHTQEVRAAKAVWPRLVDCPTLLAHDPTLGALLMTGCAGEVGAVGAGAAVAVGRLVARLHAIDVTDPDPVPLQAALAQRFEAAWRQSPGALGALRDRARATFERCRPALGSTRRWCHRDLQPANWVWDGARAALVDWEHARLDAPALDLARLAGTAVWEDVRSGYGDVNDEALRAAVALEALATTAWASRHHDPTSMARGRAALESL